MIISLPARIPDFPFGKKAAYSIISDDGDLFTGKLLVELCKAFNIRISVAGTVNAIESNIEFWQKHENYLEMLNHSWSHPGFNEHTPEEIIEHEYIDAASFFQERFETPQFTFIPPFNYIPPQGYKILKKANILACRCYGKKINSISPINGCAPGQWLNLYSFGIGDIDPSCEPTAQRNKWFDQTLDENGWLIEMWHNVFVDYPANYQPLPLSEAIAHLSDALTYNKIWIASFTEAVAWFYQKQILKPVAKIEHELLSLTFIKLNPDVPNAVYDILEQTISVRPFTEIFFHDKWTSLKDFIKAQKY